MKKLYVYKKYYKGISWEKIFGVVLSIVLVLETNLISHTLEISTMLLVIIGMLTILLLLASVLIRGYRMNAEIQVGNRMVVSDNALRALKIVRTCGWVPVIPLCLVPFANRDNLKLSLLLISIWLLLLIKYYFDDIITFTNKGYSSGFDEIELDDNCRVELKKTKNASCVGEIICIELYKEDKFMGWDKVSQTDGEYIINYLKKY